MNALRDELTNFAHGIVLGQNLPPDMAAVNQNYPVATAIDIYRNNYRGNLHDTLAGAYPVIVQLVGEVFFRHMTQQFIVHNLSRSGNLHHYGAQMPGFISDFKSAQGLPYLSDVAKLEWACHRAYFAEDTDPLDIGKLAQISPDQYASLLLHIHPACQVVRSQYPVAAIWHAHQPDLTDDFSIDLASGASVALVYRSDGVVLISDISAADAAWVQGIQTGISLGAVTDETLRDFPDFDLQAALVNLIALGVLTDITLEEGS